MDNVTHSLTGLALSRAGLDRFCPRAVWLLLLSANAPDVDVVAAPQGAFRYLEVHRGYTHSLLVMPFLAALAVVVVAAISRKKLPWIRAWLLCLAGLASHLLLDWTNSYGVRLCLPFSSRWFHLDLNSLFDAWILAVLLFAAIWPFFSRLVNREIGVQRSPAGRALAIVALSFFVLFDVGRAALHNRTVAQLQSRLYDGLPPIQTAALPDPFSPLRWTAVVETAGAYRLSMVDPLRNLNLEDAATFYKPLVTPSLDAARRVDPFRYFLYFSRFPVWSIQPVLGANARGTRLDLTDLRFGTPGSGSFHCVAYENQLNQVIEKRFTYASGVDLGWNGARGTDPAQ
jgi:inner membrane protein